VHVVWVVWWSVFAVGTAWWLQRVWRLWQREAAHDPEWYWIPGLGIVSSRILGVVTVALAGTACGMAVVQLLLEVVVSS
jgi:hypothetical protein